MQIEVPVSVGEAIDKLTILEIKLARIADPAKRANIERERALLAAALERDLKRFDELIRNLETQTALEVTVEQRPTDVVRVRRPLAR